MPFMPFHVLGIWLRGLIAFALLGVGLYLLREWYEHGGNVQGPPHAVRVDGGGRAGLDEKSREIAPPRREGVQVRPTSRWHLGLDRESAYLIVGLTLVLTSLFGGPVGYPLLRKRGVDDPRVQDGTNSARGGVEHRLRRPDGTELRVVVYGPEEGPAIVLTHGWGLNSAIWHYARAHLAGRYRLILWDLPGLGQSGSPANSDWSLEKMAGDLHAVLELAGPGPAILLGHSIGGMITLTFCRLFPEALGERVAGLVLVHTTYTNPLKTASNAGFYTAIQKPVLEPLCYLMIWLAPLVWLMNWMSYRNGSLHRSTDRDSFSGNESWPQLDFAARSGAKAWPSVVARGMLGMFRYDATDVLGRIGVPTLVVAGDQDPTTKPEANAFIAQSIPNATLVTLQPAKHLGHFEHHAQFAEAVDRFVATCAAKAGAAE